MAKLDVSGAAGGDFAFARREALAGRPDRDFPLREENSKSEIPIAPAHSGWFEFRTGLEGQNRPKNESKWSDRPLDFMIGRSMNR